MSLKARVYTEKIHVKARLHRRFFCRGNSMQFLWRESCNFKIARGIFHRIPLGSVARTSMKKIYTAVRAKLDIRELILSNDGGDAEDDA